MLFLVSVLMAAMASAQPVPLLQVEGGIDPGTAAYIIDGIGDAEASGAPLILIQLDTPGGLLSSTREIVSKQLKSEVPVVVFVSPDGSRAGSAGVFITMAAHFAVMAPTTTIGAAHPVSLFGNQSGADEGEAEDGVMEQKILEDTLAWSRAIAEKRGRNVEWSQSAVTDSAAVTATEAVNLGVVDFIAEDISDLLKQLDGREVNMPGGVVALHTDSLDWEVVPMTFSQRILHVLGDPNLIFVLVGLGLLGLYIEFYNPGLIVPGAIGVLLLVAAGTGLSVLPFNVGGLLLMVLAFALFALEVHVASFGLLAFAGVVALLVGGGLLFSVPEFDLAIHPGVLWGVALPMGLLCAGLAALIVRDRMEQAKTGVEGLVGVVGKVLVGGAGQGRVRVLGEDWAGRWEGELSPGQAVVVVRVEGLILDVTVEGLAP